MFELLSRRWISGWKEIKHRIILILGIGVIFYHAAIVSQFPALPAFTTSKPNFHTACDQQNSDNPAGNMTGNVTENWNQCSSECKSYYFDKSLWEETTITEFKLVCDKDWYRDIQNYALYVGVFIGTLTTGSVSDAIGRQQTLFYGQFIAMILFFLHLVVSDVIGFAVIRFLLGALYLLLYG